jgi:hypothetical protein
LIVALPYDLIIIGSLSGVTILVAGRKYMSSESREFFALKYAVAIDLVPDE